MAKPFLRRAVSRLLLGRGFPKHHGVVGLPELRNPVEVRRDRWGVPSIYAETAHDLYCAVGFVHAQDRLWQMETLRRMAAGTLSEIIGESMLLSDKFSHLIGLPSLCEKAVDGLTDEGKAILESYTAGVNGFLRHHGNRLPMEFRMLGCTPAPWELRDCFAGMAVNSWYLQSNYLEEMFALRARQRLSTEQWNELFPSHPDANLPEDRHFHKYRSLRFGEILPEAMGSHHVLFAGGGGSNSWVVSEGASGKPLLANDPHLAMLVPQIWYFCHLQCPGLHVCGGTVPGAPLVVLGRNEDIAWSFTNSMSDCIDLFLFEVDPSRPTLYRVGEEMVEMEADDISLPQPEGQKETFRIFRTVHGPVITEVKRGVEAAAALKWHGTLTGAESDITTVQAFVSLNRARSVDEAFEASRLMSILSQNMIVADRAGNTGWCVFGSLPVRKGYSGRLPADGSEGSMDWVGFRPPEELPRRTRPPEGYLASANDRISDPGGGDPISYCWAAPYRVERITELLTALQKPGPEEFRKMQMDCRCLRAERHLEKIVGYPFTIPEALEARELLARWNREMRADSCGAAVYEVFLWQFLATLLSEVLGSDLGIYLAFTHGYYSIIDAVMESEDVSKWRTDPQIRLPAIVEEALKNTVLWIRSAMGGDRKRWSWGRIHRYVYRHPGAKGKIAEWLLNRGPYPAPGNCTTINVSGYALPHRGYEVSVIPSMRFIADMGDDAKAYFCCPMGQSGHPGHRHYDDMIELYRNGGMVPLYLAREEAVRAARKVLKLEPAGS